MAKRKAVAADAADVEPEASVSGGVSIGGDADIKAGRDANIAGGDIKTGQSLEFKADWKDSALSVLGDAEASPVVQKHVNERLDSIETELAKDNPDTGFIQRMVGEIEQVIPIVATTLRAALAFVK